MADKKFKYGNIFTYASLQFSGNIEEYFAQNTKKLAIFLVMPRLKNKGNPLRIYENGKLIKEEIIKLPENVLLYYLMWLINYWKIMLIHFSATEKIVVISFHPISLFGLSLQKLLRKITFVFWIGDYFPPSSTPLKLYEAIKKYYHDKIIYTCYLGDGINDKMNGSVKNTSKRKTVMWGVKPKKLHRKPVKNKFTILFVGLVKESQGLHHVFSYLKEYKDSYLYILGICDPVLYRNYQKMIKSYNIAKQVYFPNRFFSDKEVDTLSEKCHVGIAMYNTDPQNPTFYTDPGKVKAYMEMGVPIIMSDVSAVASFIKKFKAGEVIVQDSKAISNAITKMKKNYKRYENGVEKFNNYFYYENYYEEKFKFLEKLQ